MITVAGAAYFLNLFANLTQPLDRYFLALSFTEITPTMTALDIGEPMAESYLRVAILNDDANWEINGTYLTNRNDITFPEAEEEWGIVRSWALCTTDYGEGEILVEGKVEEPLAVETGDQPSIPAGSIYIDVGVDGWSM